MTEMSEEELATKVEEIPEEFRDFFANLRLRINTASVEREMRCSDVSKS